MFQLSCFEWEAPILREQLPSSRFILKSPVLRFRKNSMSVCSFQSMKSPVELNSLFSKFFCYSYHLVCYITWHLIRCNSGWLANEGFTSNTIVYLKQYLSSLKIKIVKILAASHEIRCVCYSWPPSSSWAIDLYQWNALTVLALAKEAPGTSVRINKVCNFQTTESAVELNRIFLKFLLL